MHKSTLFLALLVNLVAFRESEAMAQMALKTIQGILKQIFGDEIKNAAAKVHGQLEENLGQDISIGETETMNVNMIREVEPFRSQVIATDYMSNKAYFLLTTLRPLKTIVMKKTILKTHPAVQSELNEVIGIFMVLNESDSAAAEVLLSAQPCLLSRDDEHFKRVANPCHQLSEEIFKKIIDRFEEIEAFRKHLDVSVKIAGEWDTHWRQIIGRLDQYASTVLDLKNYPRWKNIKTFCDNLEKK